MGKKWALAGILSNTRLLGKVSFSRKSTNLKNRRFIKIFVNFSIKSTITKMPITQLTKNNTFYASVTNSSRYSFASEKFDDMWILLCIPGGMIVLTVIVALLYVSIRKINLLMKNCQKLRQCELEKSSRIEVQQAQFSKPIYWTRWDK